MLCTQGQFLQIYLGGHAPNRVNFKPNDSAYHTKAKYAKIIARRNTRSEIPYIKNATRAKRPPHTKVNKNSENLKQVNLKIFFKANFLKIPSNIVKWPTTLTQAKQVRISSKSFIPMFGSLKTNLTLVFSIWDITKLLIVLIKICIYKFSESDEKVMRLVVHCRFMRPTKLLSTYETIIVDKFIIDL